jgi:hypothetical protein
MERLADNAFKWFEFPAACGHRRTLGVAEISKIIA